jgi:hypothetical protein
MLESKRRDASMSDKRDKLRALDISDDEIEILCSMDHETFAEQMQTLKDELASLKSYLRTGNEKDLPSDFDTYMRNRPVRLKPVAPRMFRVVPNHSPWTESVV